MPPGPPCREGRCTGRWAAARAAPVVARTGSGLGDGLRWSLFDIHRPPLRHLGGAETGERVWSPPGSAVLSETSTSNKLHPLRPRDAKVLAGKLSSGISEIHPFMHTPGVAHLPARRRQEILSGHFPTKRVGVTWVTSPDRKRTLPRSPSFLPSPSPSPSPLPPQTWIALPYWALEVQL